MQDGLAECYRRNMLHSVSCRAMLLKTDAERYCNALLQGLICIVAAVRCCILFSHVMAPFVMFCIMYCVA